MLVYVTGRGVFFSPPAYATEAKAATKARKDRDRLAPDPLPPHGSYPFDQKKLCKIRVRNLAERILVILSLPSRSLRVDCRSDCRYPQHER